MSQYHEGNAEPGRASGRAGVHTLSLDDKVRLLTGADNWRTHDQPTLGLRPIVMSDGPAGVRGVTMDERNPSASLPCPAALGATWDPGLVQQLAAALGTEAKSKGIDVLLGPTINLMRTPLGGRGFECFSEDPVLTSRIAVAYVRGLQSTGVAATLKHYAGNDSETGRWTYDVRAAEHVLRELYLAPFEACVREADAGLIMAGYNAVNGITMTEHARLLTEILKREWGFDGVVVSDWHATRSTVATAAAGLDLAMPGPNSPWGEKLTAAIRSGQLDPDLVDGKVSRILRLASRVGALSAGASAPDPDHHEPVLADPRLLRRAAAAAFVLLRNEGGVLPLSTGISSVALIGPNAVAPITQGGGSAAVNQVSVSTPADALTAALADRASVTVTPGCITWATVPEPATDALRDPVTGERGTRLEFRTEEGVRLREEHRTATMFTWWQGGLPEGIGWGGRGTIVLRTRFRASQDGPHLIGAGGVGQLRLIVDGAVAAAGTTPVPDDPVEVMVRPGEIRATIGLRAGQEAGIEISLLPDNWAQGPVAIRLGIVPAPDEDSMLSEAVRAAAQADAAVVVVGSGPATESEGFDRPGLALPGRQDELVRRVAEVNAKTIVVVNAGMPVLMPWAEQVAAVGYSWLPGQAMGDALADVLLGHAEPGGRLPVTIPAAEADCPVLRAVPVDGRLDYDEGLLIGYRGYDRAGTRPRYPFGHGLGYTTWAYESVQADTPASTGTVVPAGADLDLTVAVRNTGPRTGREVIQAYVAEPPPPTHLPIPSSLSPFTDRRPVRALAAFGAAVATPGERAEVQLRIPARAFARYDEQAGRWIWPPGEYEVQVGRSSRDLPLSLWVKST
jgi:beta-glucosidase